MSKKSKFFRVAVAGSTTDGRVIEATWIQQMADSYNQNTYTALGNLEHYRGFSPSSEFGTYAKVTAVKAEEVEVNGVKKLALFAQVDAFDQLIELHNRGQKLFTSIEVNPNFADTGKAYLIGLAFTDSPASLGTQVMEFASKNPEANPFTSKKHDAENLFTAAEEAYIEFEAPESQGIFKKFMDLLKPKLEEKDNKDNGKFTEISACLDEVAKTFNQTKTDLEKLQTSYADLQSKHTNLEKSFNILNTKLGNEQNPGTPPAPENTGNFSEQIEC